MDNRLSRENKILNRCYVPSGTMLIEQDNLGNRAFFIESGAVEVFTHDKRARKVELALIEAGSIVGEMALLGSGERSANVRTTQDCVLIAITARDVEDSVGQADGLLKKMMAMMAGRMHETNIRLSQRAHQMSEIVADARLTIAKVAEGLPPHKQKDFRSEVMPLRGRLKMTLQRYAQ